MLQKVSNGLGDRPTRRYRRYRRREESDSAIMHCDPYLDSQDLSPATVPEGSGFKL